MKAKYTALLLACILTTTGHAEDTTTNEVNHLILEELRGIRVSLDRIADELSEYQKANKAQKAIQNLSVDPMQFTPRGPDIAALAELSLPNDPSPDEVKKYILDIVSASQRQNSFCDSDPQVALLTHIGSENLALLIDSLTYARSMNDYHVERAIVRLANESNKALVLDALPIHHELISAIIQRGWEKDARDILLTELQNTGEHLPTEWIQAVAILDDSESYPLLRNYFINGQNRSWTYKVIKHLPIEDISGAVAEAWQRSKYDYDGNRICMANIAVEYGHLDALAILIDSLICATPNSRWSNPEVRPTVLRYTGFRGSNDALARWFETNRDLLRFDQNTKKYVIDKEVEENSPDKE